ncbi:terminase family protein [Bradyrhizobium jicamae]|uniref:Terminase family protein n=1 Tax=Bradyrhizobium jicamae TaxID=280332 RepID=A0ABS5FB04_9BRAD|nr:terminase family protein [Bradyrhizobium jicamae]MBR0793964.1 terminase family protein [Bradyrhizobium jicamae]
MSMVADLLRAIDPAQIAADADLIADDWQLDFIRSDAAQMAALIPRQHGKTEAAVLKALSIAMSELDSLIVIASPAQRLSDEFIRRARKAYERIDGAPPLVGDAARRLEFQSGSRILAVPGDNDGDTIRGLANVRLAIIDECSRCSDDLIAAIRPFLATNKRGQLIYLSTPAGKRGVFYETWVSSDSDWKRIHVKLGSCSRITSEFLDRERKNLGPTKFAQEYECEFLDNDDAAFSTTLIDAIVDPNLKAIRW